MTAAEIAHEKLLNIALGAAGSLPEQKLEDIQVMSKVFLMSDSGKHFYPFNMAITEEHLVLWPQQ